jgi:glycosyltransferase involved in cell wall biosynthesis
MSLRSKSRENTVSKKVLIVINADTTRQPEAPKDRSKERLADYTALKKALQGEILDWNDIARSRWAKPLAKFGGKGLALAVLAFARRQRYGLFYCDSENNALPLALLLKLSRTKNKPLLTIGHWITPRKKAMLIKWLRLHSHISTIFVHSSVQYNKGIDQLGIPANRIQMLPYQVDTEFWKLENANPARPDQKPYICTVGLEFRDYPTLIEAVRGLEIELKIAAASHWSKRKNTALEVDLPSNVSVRSYNYVELRDLYAGSSFVVVPLYDVDFQAGITVILEAMALGKAVIVTRSEGQGDTIVGQGQPIAGRSIEGKFSAMFGGNEIEGVAGPTGCYVAPANVDEMRRTIQYLIDHSDEAAAMGVRGRRTVETLMNVEQFAARIRRAVLETIGQPA